MSSSIIEIVANHSEKQPDKLCLADSNKALTYRQVWESVYGLSRKLSSIGMGKGTTMVLECNQSVDILIYEFALQLLGGIFVPLEKNAAESRVLEIIGDVDAKLYVGKTDPGYGLIFMDINASTDFACTPPPLPEIHFPGIDDTSEILFSTGTTGKSKGVELCHRNSIGVAENVKYGTEMGPDNVELVPMPISHSYGLRRTYGNLLNGSSVVLIDGVIMIQKMFNLIDTYGVTSMAIAPSILSIIFKLSKDKIGEYRDQLDYIQLGSAPLPEEHKQKLSELLPKTRLYNFYGSTEAGCSCLLDFNEVLDRPGCIGRPAKNAHFVVVDDERNVIESSRENLGLLASSGSINMKGYWQEPELTRLAMDEAGLIYTKDLGYIDDEGLIYMLGRKDDVINFGGINISPEEIEVAVRRAEIVEDCACVPIDDKLTGQAPKLFISLKPGETYDAREFKEFLSNSLDANKMPKIIEIIDEIPRTYNGKIQRKKLMGEKY